LCHLTPLFRHGEDRDAITIQFEEAKTSQSDGGDSFNLDLCVIVKMSLMITPSTGTNARYSGQHRDYQHQ
jgi:hypothetical protein